MIVLIYIVVFIKLFNDTWCGDCLSAWKSWRHLEFSDWISIGAPRHAYLIDLIVILVLKRALPSLILLLEANGCEWTLISTLFSRNAILGGSLTCILGTHHVTTFAASLKPFVTDIFKGRVHFDSTNLFAAKRRSLNHWKTGCYDLVFYLLFAWLAIVRLNREFTGSGSKIWSDTFPVVGKERYGSCHLLFTSLSLIGDKHILNKLVMSPLSLQL